VRQGVSELKNASASRLRQPANKTEGPFDLTGAQWIRFSPRKRAACIETAFQYWRRRGFPYYRLTLAEMRSEWRRLSLVEAEDVIQGNQIRGTNAGIRLASCFHPQMWSVQVSRYKRPVDCFRDDKCLRAVIRRALTLWPDRHGANASSVRIMLKTFSNCATVSNFRPAVARSVIQTFSAPGDTVVDFAAGYGGRLVGSLSLLRHYVGVDPCSMQVRGLNRCIQTIQRIGTIPGTAEIHEGCAEDLLPHFPSRSSRLVFSSPPYFDWEKYSRQKTQSFIRYKSYSDWLGNFLRPVVEQSNRILAKGGSLVINVPNGKSRIPLLNDLTRAAERVGFQLHRVFQLRLSKVAYMHPRGSKSKWEAIAVFTK
jgi:hypothetical protein